LVERKEDEAGKCTQDLFAEGNNVWFLRWSVVSNWLRRILNLINLGGLFRPIMLQKSGCYPPRVSYGKRRKGLLSIINEESLGKNVLEYSSQMQKDSLAIILKKPYGNR